MPDGATIATYLRSEHPALRLPTRDEHCVGDVHTAAIRRLLIPERVKGPGPVSVRKSPLVNEGRVVHHAVRRHARPRNPNAAPLALRHRATAPARTVVCLRSPRHPSPHTPAACSSAPPSRRRSCSVRQRRATAPLPRSASTPRGRGAHSAPPPRTLASATLPCAATARHRRGRCRAKFEARRAPRMEERPQAEI